MSFEPLLPDDMFSLAERGQSLREWTLGFQEELAGADDDVRSGWSQALKDALSDVEAISSGLANAEDLDDDNTEDEADLFALADHVRMAALLLTPSSTRATRTSRSPAMTSCRKAVSRAASASAHVPIPTESMVTHRLRRVWRRLVQEGG